MAAWSSSSAPLRVGLKQGRRLPLQGAHVVVSEAAAVGHHAVNVRGQADSVEGPVWLTRPSAAIRRQPAAELLQCGSGGACRRRQAPLIWGRFGRRRRSIVARRDNDRSVRVTTGQGFKDGPHGHGMESRGSGRGRRPFRVAACMVQTAAAGRAPTRLRRSRVALATVPRGAAAGVGRTLVLDGVPGHERNAIGLDRPIAAQDEAALDAATGGRPGQADGG